MRVLLLSTSYPPETCAPAKRMGALAASLKARGHEVEVVTLAPNYPRGKVFDGFGVEAHDVRDEEGIVVHRLRPWIVPKHRLILRVLAEIGFVLRAANVIMRAPAFAVVFATSPGMFMGATAMVLASIRQARYVWDVRDLIWRYTQAIGQTPFRRLAGDALERLMVLVASRAALLTTTTEAQASYFVERLDNPPEMLVVPNGVVPVSENAAPQGPRDDGAFRVTYAGLVGYPQGLGTLLDAARRLEGEGVEIVIAGEGVERAILVERCRAENLAHVRFPGYLSQDELQALYAESDVLYAQLRGEPVFASAQPSKVWEYMAAGRPVIYGGQGEAARAVEKSRGGIVVPPDDPEALADAVRTLRADEARREELARAGLAHVMEYHVSRRLMEGLVRKMEDRLAPRG